MTVPFHRVSTADTNAVNIKPTSGRLKNIYASNKHASLVAYLQLFDVKVPPVPGTDVPIQTYAIPAGATGGIANLYFGDSGLTFVNGLGMAIVGTNADNSVTGVGAGDVVVNMDFN